MRESELRYPEPMEMPGELVVIPSSEGRGMVSRNGKPASETSVSDRELWVSLYEQGGRGSKEDLTPTSGLHFTYVCVHQHTWEYT